jgi:hypothetical protein
MKKTKVAMVLLTAVLVLSILNIAASALVQIPNTGKKTSQLFLVSGSSVQPSVTKTGMQFGGDRWATNVTGIFLNNEAVDVYGVATATVGISPTETKTQSSDRTLIHPGETKWIYISFKGLTYQNFYSCMITFKAEPISGSTGGGTQTARPTGGGATTYRTPSGSGAGFDFASVGIAIAGVAVLAVGSVFGFMMLKKTRFSEQKVRRFTSYEYQDWVMQRLGGRSGSVLDSRKGIDGFTGANVPISIKQSDNVSRLQVDSFMNALTQGRLRNGVMVAYGFDTEAFAAVSRARMNRVDIKLVTVKELIDSKDTVLL